MFRSKFVVVALVIWLATLTGVTWLLFLVRANTLASLDSEQAQQAWLKWKQNEADQSESGTEPVRRKVPKSDEPPALLLMRDRFAPLLAGALVTWSFFFGFSALVLHGLLHAKPIDRRDGDDLKRP